MAHVTRLALVLLVAYAALGGAQAAHAAAKTASMSVSVEVVDTCNITVAAMSGAGSARCALATPYRVVTSSAAADANAAGDAVVTTNSSPDQANGKRADTGVVMTIIF